MKREIAASQSSPRFDQEGALRLQQRLSTTPPPGSTCCFLADSRLCCRPEHAQTPVFPYGHRESCTFAYRKACASSTSGAFTNPVDIRRVGRKGGHKPKKIPVWLYGDLMREKPNRGCVGSGPCAAIRLKKNPLLPEDTPARCSNWWKGVGLVTCRSPFVQGYLTSKKTPTRRTLQ